MKDLTRNDWMLIGIAVVLAVVAATIVFPNSIGYVVDSVIDTFVVLTTSEEHRLSQLEPETQAKARELMGRCHAKGLTLYVGQTLRTSAEEKAAVDSGHSGVKTNSWHESGRAIDFRVIDPDTLSPDLAGRREDLYLEMQREAVAMGFEQYAFDTTTWEKHYITNASGKKIWDAGHVHWRGGYSSASDALTDYLG